METPSDAPAPRRRGPRVALAAAAIAMLGAAAVLAWQFLEQRAVRRAAALAAFDLDAAMNLAGAAVPPEVDSFYFFVLDSDRHGESDELAAKLLQAAAEREYLGITGPDFDHNRAVLRAALALLEARDLAGLVVVYVGPAAHQEELARRVHATGAECRYVVYTPGGHETI